jgi:hypothetical protein
MTVPATSYEAQISAGLIAMLAANVAFQAACAVATATDARACIVEDDAGRRRAPGPTNVDGTTLNLNRTWAAVRVGSSKTSLRAWQTYGRNGDAQILIVQPRAIGETTSEADRRARNLAGGIRDEFNTLWGQIVNGTPTPAAGDIEVAAPVIADETDILSGSILIHLDISWRDIP